MNVYILEVYSYHHNRWSIGEVFARRKDAEEKMRSLKPEDGDNWEYRVTEHEVIDG